MTTHLTGEEVRKQADKFFNRKWEPAPHEKLTQLLLSALQAERERAAQVVEEWARQHSGSQSCQHHAQEIIRALAAGKRGS